MAKFLIDVDFTKNDCSFCPCAEVNPSFTYNEDCVVCRMQPWCDAIEGELMDCGDHMVIAYDRPDWCPLIPIDNAKWLYRLESTDPEKGLWYDANGELVWTIGQIPDCDTKHLPMDYDERYRQDGRMWHSSCTRREDLSHWYTLDAALELINDYGFVFARYLATEYHEYEKETVFIKDTCLCREELDIVDVFK